MEAIIRFLQDTGFYLFTQDGNWRCLVMIGIACVLLYLGIVKKFEPLLLVPIAFGMLITNLPGANMFHEIFFAGGHIHWDIIGGKPITAELLSELYNQGVAENVLSPYLQQLMTAAQTMFSPEAVSSTIAEITASATDGISAFGAQLEALVQAEQAASYYGMTLSDVSVSAGLVDILYLGVKLGIYPCLIFMGVGAMTDFGPLIANPKGLLRGEYGALPGEVNPEVRALAGIDPEEVITCRPADNIAPELEKYKEEFKEIAKSEEDVLSLALFPQVAPKFLAWRDGEHDTCQDTCTSAAPAAGASQDPNAVRELYVEYKF